MTVTALVWPDGRVFVCHDPEVPMMEDYHNPYPDIEKARKVQIKIEKPEELST